MNLKREWFNLRTTSKLPVNLFTWLGAKDLASFAHVLSKLPKTSINAGLPLPVPRCDLIPLVKDFHQTINTVTENVSEAMNNYENNQEILRCSHQPNIFPALNIIALPILLSKLAIRLNHEKPSVSWQQVFFLLDYDVASDNRFRVAHFPSRIAKSGYWTIATHNTKAFSNRTMFSVPPPTMQWLDNVFSQVHIHALQEIKTSPKSIIDRGVLDANIEFCRKLAMMSIEKSKSLTEFNAFFISLLVNRYWNLPTLFIPGNQALRRCEDHFVFLWESSAKIYKAKLKAAELMDMYGFPVKGSLIGSESQLNFWVICECGERLAMNSEDFQFKTITAQCLVCGQTYKYMMNQKAAFRELVRDGRIMPRIVADNLFDTIAWGFHAGVSYVGSAEHYLFTLMVASQLGIKPLPEFLWRAELSKQEDDKLFAISSSVSPNNQTAHLNDVAEDIKLGKVSSLYYLSVEDQQDIKSRLLNTQMN